MCSTPYNSEYASMQLSYVKEFVTQGVFLWSRKILNAGFQLRDFHLSIWGREEMDYFQAHSCVAVI